MSPPMPSSSSYIGGRAPMQPSLSHDLSFLLPSNRSYTNPITDSAPTTSANSPEAVHSKVTATPMPVSSSHTSDAALTHSPLSKDLSCLQPRNLCHSNLITDGAPTNSAVSPYVVPRKVTATPLPVFSSRTSDAALTHSSLSKDLSFLLPKYYPDSSTAYALPDSSNTMVMETTGTPMPRSSIHTDEPALTQSSPPANLSFPLPSKHPDDSSNNSPPHISTELPSVLSTGFIEIPIPSSLAPKLDVPPPHTSKSHDLSFLLPKDHNNPITDPASPTLFAPSSRLSLESKPPATSMPSMAAHTYSDTYNGRNDQDEEHTAGAGSDSCKSETESGDMSRRSSRPTQTQRRSSRVLKRKGIDVEDEERTSAGEKAGNSTEQHTRFAPADVAEGPWRRTFSHVLIPARRGS